MGETPTHARMCTHMHAHTHTCTHVHARACMHYRHDNFMQMAAPIGISQLGIPYDVIHACVHMHTWWGLPTPTPTHPPTPQGGPPSNQ